MIRQRYDRQRLNAVQPDEVSARRCPATDALVAACRADVAARPLVVLGTTDAEVARRACLWLDGSWWLQDASAAGRLAIRLKALWRDRAPTSALRDDDAWDPGWARDGAALAGLVPRRATLVVLQGPLDPAVLSALARASSAWRRPVRVLLLP